MQNDTYTLLTNDAEKIRKNPGMYIGSDENATQLCIEVIDNLLDEIAANRASTGYLYFNPDGSFWCMDNGRGIHVYEKALPDGSTIDSVKMLCTLLHSGSKFENDEYDTHIGMHGIGLVAVNALSEWVVIKTRDRVNKTKVYEYTFQDFELVNKIESQNNESWSTIVGFRPSEKYFESIEIDKREIVEKLILCQAKYDHAVFKINDRDLPKRTFIELVRQKLELKDTDQIYRLNYDTVDKKGKPYKIDVYVTYTYSQDTITIGDTNLRPCSGKYIEHIKALIRDKISTRLDKKFNESDPKHILIGMRLYVSLIVPRAKFDGQVKNKMTLNVKDILVTPLESQIDWFIVQKGIIDIVHANLELRLKRELVKIKSHTKFGRVSAKNKLKDCSASPGDVLYIVEGDSAGGTVNQARNKRTEALFPLRGKVLNVESSTIDKINKNEEIKQLIEVLGPQGNRRYKQVKILGDADADGQHIAVLVILLLYKIARDLIEEGRVSVIIPPLYGATKGTQYIPIYSESDRLTYREQGYSITRFKGLGEMSPSKLKHTLYSNMEWIVKLPDTPSKEKAIISIITDSNLKRVLLNDDRCCFENVIRKVVEAQTL